MMEHASLLFVRRMNLRLRMIVGSVILVLGGALNVLLQVSVRNALTIRQFCTKVNVIVKMDLIKTICAL